MASRLGVTGHRRLRAHPDLTGAVDDALARVEGRLPGPWTLLSGMAEGADRLVADRVLARADWSLHALLPLPADDYADDFAPGAPRDALRAQLAACTRVEVAPGGRPRPGCYADAGRALVEASDALLALWNGRAARGEGGTAHVVADAEGARLPVVWVRAADTRDAGGPVAPEIRVRGADGW